MLLLMALDAFASPIAVVYSTSLPAHGCDMITKPH
jgi:hypothetical protein